MGEYKFQSLLVYQLSLNYIDQAYELIKRMPANERYNLSAQFTRAATSIALNIAEGSTGQTDKEQLRFLSMALRSFIESVACLDMIEMRGYIPNQELISVRKTGRTLFYKITKFQKALGK
jgi:four helix bundle protein